MEMETKDHVCKLAKDCKVAGDPTYCNQFCPVFMLLHGQNGDKGVWKGSNVPQKYENSFMSNLPIKEDNPTPYEMIERYVTNVKKNVSNGIGLFMYSVPNKQNRFGTGTGKTSSAITILNEYLLERVKEHSQGIEKMDMQPAIFYKASEFQVLYNQQYKGTPDMKEKATFKFERVKRQLKNTELLVFDDIGIRTNITENFENELTEIIDSRDSKQLATIYTSNLPLEKVAETMGDRIASRIEGMTVEMAFKGSDKRKGGIL